MNELDRLALSDAETFQDRDRIDRIFAALRAEDPVAWCPEPYGRGFWAITKYHDIEYVSKNPQLFSSDGKLGGIILEDPDETQARVKAQRGDDERRIDDQGGVSPFAGGRSMIMLDPPEHTAQRRLVAPGFTPGRLTAMEEGIRERVIRILDRLEGQTECDFVQAVAAELPIQVLAELFGVPQEMGRKLFEWSNVVIGSEDPDIGISREYVINAWMEMAAYGFKLAAERKQNPGDDLITMLVQPNASGELMSNEDYINAFLLLIVAGNETTRNSISGGMLALSQHRDQWELLLADRSLIPSAVNEIIRWVAPVTYMRRTALEDTELGGKQIRKGNKLGLWYISGNRDEDVFSDPFRFDITRDEARHLSFGYGQHLCLGWRLAEIQVTVLLTELLERFPHARVNGEVARIRTNFLNSIKRLPVSLVA